MLTNSSIQVSKSKAAMSICLKDDYMGGEQYNRQQCKIRYKIVMGC